MVVKSVEGSACGGETRHPEHVPAGELGGTEPASEHHAGRDMPHRTCCAESLSSEHGKRAITTIYSLATGETASSSAATRM